MSGWDSLDAQVIARGLAPEVGAALRDRWGHPATGHGEARRRIVLRTGTLPPAPEQAGGGGLRVRVRGDEVWIGEGLHLRVWETGAEVTVRGGGEALPEAAWTLALAETHRAGGWLAVHAAVLTGGAGAGNRGVAVGGPSGAGKSTAALRWVGMGGRLSAEDQVWVWPPTARAVGLDRWLRSAEEGVRRFAPELLGRAQGRDAHGKLCLPLTSPGAEVSLVALLVLGQPHSLTAPERVRALWEATGVPLTDLGRRRGAAGVSALLARLPVLGATRQDVLEITRARLTLGEPETGRPPGSGGG